MKELRELAAEMEARKKDLAALKQQARCQCCKLNVAAIADLPWRLRL